MSSKMQNPEVIKSSKKTTPIKSLDGKELGRFIYITMSAMGMRIRDVVRETNMRPATIVAILRGTKVPTLEQIERIGNAMQIPGIYLLFNGICAKQMIVHIINSHIPGSVPVAPGQALMLNRALYYINYSSYKALWRSTDAEYERNRNRWQQPFDELKW
jgi:transcriptional regulator with XRE-family HTH domain